MPRRGATQPRSPRQPVITQPGGHTVHSVMRCSCGRWSAAPVCQVCVLCDFVWHQVSLSMPMWWGHPGSLVVAVVHHCYGCGLAVSSSRADGATGACGWVHMVLPAAAGSIVLAWPLAVDFLGCQLTVRQTTAQDDCGDQVHYTWSPQIQIVVQFEMLWKASCLMCSNSGSAEPATCGDCGKLQWCRKCLYSGTMCWHMCTVKGIAAIIHYVGVAKPATFGLQV